MIYIAPKSRGESGRIKIEFQILTTLGLLEINSRPRSYAYLDLKPFFDAIKNRQDVSSITAVHKPN